MLKSRRCLPGSKSLVPLRLGLLQLLSLRGPRCCSAARCLRARRSGAWSCSDSAFVRWIYKNWFWTSSRTLLYGLVDHLKDQLYRVTKREIAGDQDAGLQIQTRDREESSGQRISRQDLKGGARVRDEPLGQ